MKKINPIKIKELFGKFSKDYDKHMESTNHIKVQYQILDKFLPKIRGKVLDIATGTGTIAKYIIEHTNCEVYGIDYNKRMIENAKKKARGVKFEVGDVHQLPYEDKKFDVVLCSYGFYWFKDIEKVILEIKRVLKPRGLFILLEEEFNKGDPKPRFSTYRQDYLKQLANLENYIGVNSLKRELSGLGFELIDEIKLPVDELHDTVGMLYKLYRK